MFFIEKVINIINFDENFDKKFDENVDGNFDINFDDMYRWSNV